MFTSTRIGALRVLGACLLVCLLLGPARATETILHSFGQNYSTGAHPVGQLTLLGGIFYGVTEQGGNGFGSVFTMTTAGLVKTIYEFAGGADGVEPSSGLVAAGGNFYGTTVGGGGTSDSGVVYEITPAGTTTILHAFTGYNSTTPAGSDGSSPYAALLLASDGNLYGVTAGGGSQNQGTVFTINPGGGGYSIIHNFNNTLDTAYSPVSALAESASGVLYGASTSAAGFSGGIYKLNKDGSGYTFVHGFSVNGTDPSGSLPTSDLVRATDGNLYGYCAGAGANNCGTVFKITPGATDTITPLYAFDGYTGGAPNFPSSFPSTQNRLLVGADHNLYGVTPEGGLHGLGAAFRLTLAGVCTRLTSFNTSDTYGATNPLAQSGASFYATSSSGGITASPGDPLSQAFTGYGAAVSISNAGALKLIQSFYVRDVYHCQGNLVQVGTGAASAFYGVTQYGGEYQDGAIFKIDAAGGFSIIHHFNDHIQEGSEPVGGLLLARDGFLYGTTTGGGKFNYGTIFKVSTAGALTAIHHLQAAEGYDPTCALVQGVGKDNNLYGTCYNGGISGSYLGTVFSVTTSGTKFTVLRYFTGPDGGYPSCQLLPDGSGNLYGTTYSGGANNDGTIFKVPTNGATFTTLFSFYYDSTTATYPAGYSPNYSGPMVLFGGTLFGVAEFGGANGNGVIFQCNVSTGATAALHSFNNAIGEGANPVGGFTYSSSNGTFYGATLDGGTTSDGAAGSGVIYAVNATTGALTVMHTFTGYNSGNPAASDGASPYGGVILGTDGYLYGATLNGGASDDGILFQQTTVP